MYDRIYIPNDTAQAYPFTDSIRVPEPPLKEIKNP